MKSGIKKASLVFTAGLALLLGHAQAAQAEVSAQVLKVKMQLTEKNITRVRVQGLLHNQEKLPIRGVQVRVHLLDPNRQPVRDFLLEPFDHLESGESESFDAQYTLRDYDQLYLQAEATVEYTPTSYLQIADWIMGQNWDNLRLWQIDVPQEAQYDERSRVESALKYLDMVDHHRKVYPEARRKWNLINFIYGKRLAEDMMGHEAILRLANVEDQSDYGTRAQELLDNIRVRTIYQRAMEKMDNGHLRGAYRQLMYIPENSSYAAKAQAKREALLEEMKAKRVYLGPTSPPGYLSRDQRAVWLRRQHGPEGYTTSVNREGERFRTWWYLDYSHYTFDDKGRLVNQKVY